MCFLLSCPVYRHPTPLHGEGMYYMYTYIYVHRYVWTPAIRREGSIDLSFVVARPPWYRCRATPWYPYRPVMVVVVHWWWLVVIASFRGVASEEAPSGCTAFAAWLLHTHTLCFRAPYVCHVIWIICRQRGERGEIGWVSRYQAPPNTTFNTARALNLLICGCPTLFANVW